MTTSETRYPRHRGTSIQNAMTELKRVRQQDKGKSRGGHRPTPDEPYFGIPALIGKKIGKLTIFAFHKRARPLRNSLYKGRCACGEIVYRREHWIKNPRNDGYDRCRKC